VAAMVYQCDDSHGGGYVPPCSLPASFVTAAATHHAYMMSLTGRHGSVISLAWRLQSKTAPMPTMMLLLTSPEIIANTGTKSTYYSFWKHTHHNTDKMEMVRNGPAGNIILPPPLGIIRPPLKYQSPISPATAIVKYDIIRPIR
jgi:hypothetical protein